MELGGMLARGAMKLRGNGDGDRSWLILLAGGGGFLAVGLIAVFDPIPMASLGWDNGRYGHNPGFTYSANHTVGFGILFLMIGVLLTIVALKVRKG
jgi:hypothetical protein